MIDDRRHAIVGTDFEIVLFELVARDQVKSSPAWDPLAMADQVGEQQLHRHFGWPGYGW